MEKIEVIKSIGQRSGGDIYLGVVGWTRQHLMMLWKKRLNN